MPALSKSFPNVRQPQARFTDGRGTVYCISAIGFAVGFAASCAIGFILLYFLSLVRYYYWQICWDGEQVAATVTTSFL